MLPADASGLFQHVNMHSSMLQLDVRTVAMYNPIALMAYLWTATYSKAVIIIVFIWQLDALMQPRLCID